MADKPLVVAVIEVDFQPVDAPAFVEVESLFGFVEGNLAVNPDDDFNALRFRVFYDRGNVEIGLAVDEVRGVVVYGLGFGVAPDVPARVYRQERDSVCGGEVDVVAVGLLVYAEFEIDVFYVPVYPPVPNGSADLIHDVSATRDGSASL